ncbi:DUF4351 domain-containing protein [Clostridium sp.]|jgi:predicted transcriptional regulator|uniref:DUF4351 domain-containing protein n=1 Tax=Clostridium sp. TaxID=1506 RepID=UPI0039F49B2B
MKQTNYEDIIMKRAMDLFAEEGLKFFGINKKVKEVAPTELIVLETKKMYMDYTFLMEDDSYIHFEFQTTDKGKKDLRRFRAYEALLSHQTEKDVITYVVYSGDIVNPLDSYKSGINTYRIQVISMVEKDGDKIFDEIAEKIKGGEEITKQDIITLTFTPIMGGKLTKAEKIVKAIRITKDINKYRYDVQSILYAFASKFLKERDLEKVKEELRVTELGKSLIEEGREQGLKEGLKEGKELGKAEMLIKLLMKKFKKVPEEYKEKIMKLSNDTLDLIAMEIFDINSVEELERYF